MPSVDTTVPEGARRLLDALIQGDQDFELPMLPAVAQEVLALCQSEDVDAAKLSTVLHRDQALAGNVLRIANSPLYAGAVPIVSLQQAISRMGLTALSEVAVAVAVKGKVFDCQLAQSYMAELWRHSVAAGLFAKEIARARRRNVESAFLCGLLHDVGKPVVLTALFERRFEVGADLTASVVHAAMDEYHERVGEQLARTWQMPEEVQQCARWHHGDYDNAESAAEAAMTTCLADHLAHLAVSAGYRTVTEEQCRALPVLEALNIYPDELDQLLGLSGTVMAGVEAIG